MQIAVFDLDGTLFRGSSLKEYFKFGIRRLLRGGHITEALTIVGHAIASKIRLTTHIRAKYAVCRLLSQRLTPDDIGMFVNRLLPGIDREVLALAQDCREQGMLVILSTASPEEYCLPLARRLGFDICHATPLTPTFTQYAENRGTAKVDRLPLDKGNLAIVVTDHHDDLPLLLANTGTNYLHNPSRNTVAIVRRENIDFKH